MLHVAIIMDGNGRWATARGWSRPVGHGAGAEAVRRVVQAAPSLEIGTLTLFAFSGDNWHRPAAEVSALLTLFRAYLQAETEACLARRVQVTILGRRDRLPESLLATIETVEEKTRGGRALHLRIAIDYSSRDTIRRAAHLAGSEAASSLGEFSRLIGQADRSRQPAPDVDLLIRTGGEKRLSDFLLWECAYAELLFTPKMWPDFAEEDLKAAVAEFHARERRFGRIPGWTTAREAYEETRAPSRNGLL